MDKLFDDFMLEKEYVCGLSKVTLKSYRGSWQAFKRITKEPTICKGSLGQILAFQRVLAR
jgi:hypothetical protein